MKKCIWCKTNERKKYKDTCSDRCLILSLVKKERYCWLIDRRIMGKTTTARFCYQTFFQEIPRNFIIVSTCSTPQCINPKHLSAVDHKTYHFEKTLKQNYIRAPFSRIAKWIKSKFYGVKNGLYRKCTTGN